MMNQDKLPELTLKQSVSLPQFNVRRSQEIVKDLGLKPIVDGFVEYPIYNQIDPTYDNDIGDSCNYASKLAAERGPLDSTYLDVLYTQQDLARAFAKDFSDLNKTALDFLEMHFKPQERFADATFSEVFEGYHQKQNWTDKQWSEIYKELDAILLNPNSNYSR